MNNFGISFSPFGNDNPNNNNQRGDSGGATPSPQEAIRVLSLRVPRTVGVASPIPSMLLNAQGGGGFGGGGGPQGMPPGGMEELLRRLFGQAAQGPMGMPSMAAPMGAPAGAPPAGGGSAPPPRAAPGIEGGAPGGTASGVGNMAPPPQPPMQPGGPIPGDDRRGGGGRRV